MSDNFCRSRVSKSLSCDQCADSAKEVAKEHMACTLIGILIAMATGSSYGGRKFALV